VDEQIAEYLRELCRLFYLPYRARTASLHLFLEGKLLMPATLTIDQTGTAVLQFLDDKGDVTTAPPDPTSPGALAVVAFASDNTAVATVDPAAGTVAPVTIGTFNLSATVLNSDGTPALEPDGITPFTPAPVACQVTPGAAATDALEVSVA